MLTIARLFGKSPFAPLQTHMDKVAGCMHKLKEVFDRLGSHTEEELIELVKQVSKLEHEADLTKNDIRNHLPKSLFLPIGRTEILEILSLQDDIADQAEQVGNLLTLHPLDIPDEFLKLLCEQFAKNYITFEISRRVIKEMGDLLGSSFGGVEAEKVKAMAEESSFSEYKADRMMHDLQREFFRRGDTLSTPLFYLYMKLITEINNISHVSERLANRVRMIIEVK